MFSDKFIRTAAAAILACGALTAQTQLVIGDVDGIRNTREFRLDCTADVRLVSSTVDLQQLHDQSRQQDIEYEMQVVDVSTGGTTILDVVSAVAVPEQFDMGNLRFGRTETWETFATPGSAVYTFVNLTSRTGYLPLGPAGTWVLGNDAQPIANGIASAIGRFQFRLQMPNIPSLVGTSFSAQSIVADSGNFRITNPDCKEVRND